MSCFCRNKLPLLLPLPLSLPEADLARAQKELTRYVGPVARVLVKRAAPACADLAQLWLLLADHVEGAADRAAFLQSL